MLCFSFRFCGVGSPSKTKGKTTQAEACATGWRRIFLEERYMDLARLHVFLTVAREQSFSREAEKIYRTKPAVSKLEESNPSILYLG
jgi:Bacterial regulatory helix-turn-helix protein, lysR family